MNPPHKPTEGTRAQVEALAGYLGLPQSEVAACLGITEKTLRKHYRAELAHATVRANATVAHALFQKAVNGDTTAMIFWLKARAKWSEKAVESDDDAPPPVRVEVSVVDARKRADT
jgi:hypothetical protein